MAEELWLVDQPYSDKNLVSVLRELKSEYKKQKRESWKKFVQARKHMPGGVSSNLRYFPPHPVFFNGASGAAIKDVDGMEYVDYNLSYGALILGHNHPYVMRNVRKILEGYGSTNFGASIDLETEMAERINRIIPCAERVRYAQSGTEAVMHAIRIARGYTKKPVVAKFEGHYHGTYDDVLVSTTPGPREGGPRRAPKPVTTSLGIPREMYKYTLVLPFNDLEGATRIIKENKDRIACVIMELVSKGYIPADKDFVKGIRELTEKLGIVLIFDEILTGFRVHYRGAQYVYGVKPDITTLGKIVGGGVPFSVIAGVKDIMNVVSPKSRPTPNFVYHSGTYNGSTIGLAYGLSTLDVLERKMTYPKIMKKTKMLKKGISEIFSDRGESVSVDGLGAMFNYHFCSHGIRCHRDTIKVDMIKRAVVDYTMLNNGIYVIPGRRFNMSIMHRKEDITRTLDVMENAANRIAFKGR